MDRGWVTRRSRQDLSSVRLKVTACLFSASASCVLERFLAVVASISLDVGGAVGKDGRQMQPLSAGSGTRAAVLREVELDWFAHGRRRGARCVVLGTLGG